MVGTADGCVLVVTVDGWHRCSCLELMFLETSALTGENVEEGFLKCARSILSKVDAGMWSNEEKRQTDVCFVKIEMHNVVLFSLLYVSIHSNYVILK